MAGNLKMPQTNRLIITGRLVHTPKVTRTKDNLCIASFSIANDRGFGEKKQTSFFECKAFGKTAERIEEHIKSGGIAVIIEGRIEQRSWEDKTTGGKRTAVEIIADRVDALEWPDDGGPRGRAEDKEPAQQDDDNSIPF